MNSITYHCPYCHKLNKVKWITDVSHCAYCKREINWEHQIPDLALVMKEYRKVELEWAAGGKKMEHRGHPPASFENKVYRSAILLLAIGVLGMLFLGHFSGSDVIIWLISLALGGWLLYQQHQFKPKYEEARDQYRKRKEDLFNQAASLLMNREESPPQQSQDSN